MLLYKYMPTDRFFENFKFRLTPAEDLNDPRELVPDIRLRNPDGYISDIVARNMASTYLRFQIANPHLTADDAWNRCLAAAQKFRGNFDPDAKASEIFDMFMKTTNRSIGVLSLTEDPCNELMWAHYGNNYSGFVVGLDSESPFFQPKPGEPRTCGELMNVVYTDTRPVVYVDPGKLDIPREIFFAKSVKWSYEQEWRMIKYLPQADELINAGGKEIYLFNVPVETVREVIFGSKVPPDVASQLAAKILARAPHVQIKQVSFTPIEGLKISAR